MLEPVQPIGLEMSVGGVALPVGLLEIRQSDVNKDNEIRQSGRLICFIAGGQVVMTITRYLNKTAGTGSVILM